MISIIIPCFNAELTLRATIESAFAQDVDKEVIVVDDGSTDGTGDIIRSFGKQIRPAFGPNRGAGAARNIGTRLARGDFLQYLDSDDLLMAGTLPVRLQALQSSEADVAHTDWQELIEHADGSYKPGVVRHPPLELIAMDIQVATATSRFWAPPAALLYTRAIVESVGQWREDFPIIQDARFLFDVAARGARFIYISEIGAFYRVTSTGISRNNPANFVEECIRNAAEIERLWFNQQAPTAARVEALYGTWGQLAVATATNGFDGFATARAAHNRMGPQKYAIEAAWLLRACVGKRCSALILRWALRVKQWLRACRFIGGRSVPSMPN
jgi:hypothetical protein